MDGAGAGAVVFAAAKLVFGNDLTDGQHFGWIVELGADFFLSFLFSWLGRVFALAFECNGQLGDGVAGARAHDGEAPGVGELVVGCADGGFECALKGALGEWGGEVVVDCAAVDDDLVAVHKRLGNRFR